MKYIINSAYQKINSISTILSNILHICKTGRSEELSPAIEDLQYSFENIKGLVEGPFTKKHINLMKDIYVDMQEILQLPEGIQKICKVTLMKCKHLLKELDPFNFVYDEDAKFLKGQMLEFVKELQIYLKASILVATGDATSLTDEKAIIKDVMNDITDIEVTEFTKVEQEGYTNLCDLHKKYDKNSSTENLNKFYNFSLEMEKTLTSDKSSREETVFSAILFLCEQFTKCKGDMNTEEEAFPKYTTSLKAEKSKTSIEELKKVKFSEARAEKSRQNVLFAYEIATKEIGATFDSRCRAIDFYKLLGSELDKLKKLFEDN